MSRTGAHLENWRGRPDSPKRNQTILPGDTRGVVAASNQAEGCLRLSSYSILSERLPKGGYALLNGISGALDLVADDVGNAMARALRSGPGDAGFDIGATADALSLLDFSDVESLRNRGHLTKLDLLEERGLGAEVAEAIHEVQVAVPQFVVVPNLDCNYRCSYCFERPLQKELPHSDGPSSQVQGNVVMSVDHVGAVYRAIERICQLHKRELGGVLILYGGEPLDARNRDVVFEIVCAGVARGFSFAAITNGHDLLDFLPILKRGQIAQVQVTIDGPREIHNRRRIHVGGDSSFDRIFGNLREGLACTDAEFTLRVNVDPSNLDCFERTLRLFEAEGWLNHPQVTIYANTLYSKDDEGTVKARMGNAEIYDRLREIVGGYRNVFTSASAVHAARSIDELFLSSERFRIRGTYCAGNTGNYIFAPDGHIYACWESLGRPCSRVGSYLCTQGLSLDEKATGRWFSRSVAKIPECLACNYALACGGGCAQFAEYNSGTLFAPYCDDFQYVFSRTLSDTVQKHIDMLTSLEVRENAVCRTKQ